MQRSGCRRLWALIAALPSDSAVHRQGKRWSQADELAAIAVERNDSWMRALVVGQGRKPQNVPPLPPIQHPHREVPDTQGGTVARSPRAARRMTVAEFAEEFQKEVTR